jgi:predicted nucleic acid-binding Zn ribbon protein
MKMNLDVFMFKRDGKVYCVLIDLEKGNQYPINFFSKLPKDFWAIDKNWRNFFGENYFLVGCYYLQKAWDKYASNPEFRQELTARIQKVLEIPKAKKYLNKIPPQKICKLCGKHTIRYAEKYELCYYCRVETRRNLSIKTKTCKICGKQFITQNQTQLYCSEKCKSKNAYLNKRGLSKTDLKLLRMIRST